MPERGTSGTRVPSAPGYAALMTWKRRAPVAAIVFVLLALVLVRSGFNLPPAAFRLSHVALAPATSATPPPASSSEWREAQIPWDWRPHGDGRDVWLRAEFALDEPPSAPLQLLIAQVAYGAEIFLNGEPLADVGRDPAAIWGRREPVWTPIPPHSLRLGTNQLLLRLHVRPDFAGYLTPVFVGPAEVLQGQFRARNAFISAPDLFAVVSLTLAFVYLSIYRRSREREWAWLAAGIGALCVAGLPWRAIDFWLWPLGMGAAELCIVCAAHRIGNLPRRRLERALAALLAALALASSLAPPRARFALALATAAFDLAIALHLLRLHRAAPLARWLGSTGALSAALAISMVLMVNDLPLFAGRAPLLGLSLFPIAHAPVVVASFAHIVAFLSDALARERGLNQSLHESQERLVALERAQAARVERERVQRDLHDGLGAQLVAALAVAEREPQDGGAVRRSLRLALGELRSAVDSLDSAEAELGDVLGALRARLEPLVQGGGAKFVWRVSETPEPLRLAPEQVLHLQRILQEAIANAVKHASAQTIEVASGALEDAGRRGAFVEVRDDGRGIGAAAAGRGLANMRQRAAFLGGELALAASEHGTRVRLFLPIP